MAMTVFLSRAITDNILLNNGYNVLPWQLVFPWQRICVVLTATMTATSVVVEKATKVCVIGHLDGWFGYPGFAQDPSLYCQASGRFPSVAKAATRVLHRRLQMNCFDSYLCIARRATRVYRDRQLMWCKYSCQCAAKQFINSVLPEQIPAVLVSQTLPMCCLGCSPRVGQKAPHVLPGQLLMCCLDC